MAVEPRPTTRRAPRPGGPGTVRGMLSLEELEDEVARGTIDTVVAAFTDMQGRLMGKRIQGEYFLEDVKDHGVEGCNYLLALDMEMDPVPGYSIANWEKGYGDFGIAPDMDTLRRIPWLDTTAMVLCDVVWHDGSPVAESPRQVLIAQYERAHELGYTPMMSSELEFYLYRETYTEAWTRTTADSRRPSPTSSTTTSWPRRWTSPSSISCGGACRGRGSRSSSPRARPGPGSTSSTSAMRTRSPPPTGTRSIRMGSRRSPTSTGSRRPSWPSRRRRTSAARATST